jgi:hypothetical protein
MMELDRVQRGWGGRTTVAKSWVTLWVALWLVLKRSPVSKLRRERVACGRARPRARLSYRCELCLGRRVRPTSAQGTRGRYQCVLGANCRYRTHGDLFLPISKRMFGHSKVHISAKHPHKVSSLCQILSFLCEFGV